MDIDQWKTQLRKGAMELACLAVLRERERYGLDILETLGSVRGLEISEGSIYPLLNRLQRDGKLEATWQEDVDATHPRKYYRLTSTGAGALEAMDGEWRRFSQAMDRMVEGGGR